MTAKTHIPVLPAYGTAALESSAQTVVEHRVMEPVITATATAPAPKCSAGAILGLHGPVAWPDLSPADVHSTIVAGLAWSTLIRIVDDSHVLSVDDIAGLVGISTRTLRRQRDDPEKAMAADLGSRTWLLADTLARACDVFGDREAAERWLLKPALGLSGMRAIDLLRTSQGAELVTDFLGRLAYGVYN